MSNADFMVFYNVLGNTCLRDSDENLMFLKDLEGLLTLDLSSNILDGALQEDALQGQAKLQVNILHCSLRLKEPVI